MYLNNVHISNYRCIENLQIEFRPGTNIILGDNGVGKTSILSAIATGLSGYLEGVKGITPRNIMVGDIRFRMKALGGASAAMEFLTPVEISCNASYEQEHFSWVRSRKDESSESRTKTYIRDIASATSIKHFAQDITNNFDGMLPILRYLGTARTNPSVVKASTKSSDAVNDRRCGYLGCLHSAIDWNLIKNWCLKMEMEHFFQQAPMPEYEAFKNMVSNVMMVINELDHRPKIYYSQRFGEIIYQEYDNPTPITYLSAGYQSILRMVMDIAFRIATLNPQHGEKMNKTPGIVLIDELDMALHPKWQWTVLRALRETFPNIQFIVATHSPILISSCKDEYLIHIDNDHQITYPSAAYGYSVDDVVKFVQGSYRIPKMAQDLYDQFEDAINEDDIPTARRILDEMIAEYGADNTEVKTAMTELSMADPSYDEE